MLSTRPVSDIATSFMHAYTLKLRSRFINYVLLIQLMSLYWV